MANNMLQSLLFSGGGGGSSGGGVLVVHQNADTGALDKTWQEIHDAGFAVLSIDVSDGGYEGVGFASIISIGMFGDSYSVTFAGNGLTFSASAASDYPAPEEVEPLG